jgi:hypothetical protein
MRSHIAPLIALAVTALLLISAFGGSWKWGGSHL